MSRDVTGTYTLPVGNPVSTGTSISSTWANSTLSDIASTLTNSLDRTGSGAMLSPIKVPDGNASAPGVTFSSETSTGWYRQSAGIMSAAILGNKVAEANANGVTIPAGKKLLVVETATAATDAVNLSKLQTDIATAQAATTAAIAAALPYGVIMLWAGALANIPAGWALCDGSNSTPDLRDRFVVGAGSSYAVYATGGANTVTLATTEIPSHLHGVSIFSGVENQDHSHGVNINTGGQSQSHTHTVPYTDTFATPASVLVSGLEGDPVGTITSSAASQDHIHNVSGNTAGINNTHTHTVSGNTANTGSGGAHENRPPYYALCYIMKV